MKPQESALRLTAAVLSAKIGVWPPGKSGSIGLVLPRNCRLLDSIGVCHVGE